MSLAGRKVAPLICFDIEFPEPARRVAQAGAELIATISANFDPFALDHEIPTLSRAMENRLPHLYSQHGGRRDGFEFVGGSRSMSPLGEVLYQAPADRGGRRDRPRRRPDGGRPAGRLPAAAPRRPAVSDKSLNHNAYAINAGRSDA